MSADDGRQDRDAKATSGINRREVLLTVGGVAAAVGAGALTWGGLEFLVNKQSNRRWRLERHLPASGDGVGNAGLRAGRYPVHPHGSDTLRRRSEPRGRTSTWASRACPRSSSPDSSR